MSDDEMSLAEAVTYLDRCSYAGFEGDDDPGALAVRTLREYVRRAVVADDAAAPFLSDVDPRGGRYPAESCATDRTSRRHLLLAHVDAFNAARRDSRYPGRLEFVNGYSTEWFPPGQWLLAREHCAEFHHFQTTGDPCWCGSDNCAYCAKCGFESHD